MSDAEALQSLAENHYNAIGYDAWAMLRDIASHIESLEKENAALREEVKEWRANYKDWRDSADNGDFDPMKVPTPPTTDKGE